MGKRGGVILVVLAALVLWALATPRLYSYEGVVQLASYHPDYSDDQIAIMEPEYQPRPHCLIPELFIPPMQYYLVGVAQQGIYGQFYLGRQFQSGEWIRVLQFVWREGEPDSFTLSIAW